MKKCIKCGEDKDDSNFYKNRNSKVNTCKDCCLKFQKVYRKSHPVYKQRYGIGRRTITTFGLKLALEVYDTSNRKCEICGEENDLTIHHIDGNGRHNQEKGLPMNNDINNLIVLCRKCHGSIHGKQGGGRPRRWGVKCRPLCVVSGVDSFMDAIPSVGRALQSQQELADDVMGVTFLAQLMWTKKVTAMNVFGK